MKLATHPGLMVLAIIIAIVSGGIWMGSGEPSIREGRVVIDNAFLQRLATEDSTTTRDLAIKALSSASLTFQGEILRNMLLTGAVTVDIHRLDRDSAQVTVTESLDASSTAMTWVAFRRHRLGLRELFSLAFWKSALHREYWEHLAQNGLARDYYIGEPASP